MLTKRLARYNSRQCLDSGGLSHEHNWIQQISGVPVGLKLTPKKLRTPDTIVREDATKNELSNFKLTPILLFKTG